MRTIGEYLRLYFIIEAQYIKARMQYRADFIISSDWDVLFESCDARHLLGDPRIRARPGGLVADGNGFYLRLLHDRDIAHADPV